MNVENFKKVLGQIKQNPETWYQNCWHSTCGTKHCFAGWAQILSGKPADNETARRDARIYLDLSIKEADFLFSHNRSIADFESALNGGIPNRDGYDKAWYNRDGYDRDGYDRYGYDRSGYDIDGLDSKNRPRI